MRDVGPGGHYFGTAHTLARYETAFYSPILSDWRITRPDRSRPADDLGDHANRVFKETLAHYERPPLDPAIGGA